MSQGKQQRDWQTRHNRLVVEMDEMKELILNFELNSPRPQSSRLNEKAGAGVRVGATQYAWY